MNPTPTREELDDFITEYNKRMKCNAEIRSRVDENFVNTNEDIKGFLDYWLPVETLSEEDTDEENVDVIDNNFCPELYETVVDDGCVVRELHTHSITHCHHQYYFVRASETIEDYKKRVKDMLLDDIVKVIVGNDREKERLMEENTRLYRLKRMIES